MKIRDLGSSLRMTDQPICSSIHSEIKTEGYANLNEDQKVTFEVGQGKKGPCANNVVPV